MTVTECQLYRYRLPLRRSVRLPDGDALATRAGILLRLTTADGFTGWGDAAPLPGWSREELPDCLNALQAIAGELQGRTVDADWVLHRRCDGRLDAEPPSVRFCVESALLDVLARQSGLGLRRILFDGCADAVTWNALVDPTQPDAMEDALARYAEGYRTFKVKVGRRPALEDEAFLAEFTRQASDVWLRLDANRSWGVDEASEAWRMFCRFPVEYLEEPLNDPEALVPWAARAGAPLAVDETAVAWGRDVFSRIPGLRAVVLKPTFLGGVLETVSWITSARARGCRPVLSAAFESGVGIRVLANLAAGTGHPPVACGLEPYDWLAEDVVEPALSRREDTLDLSRLDRTVLVLRKQFLQEL